jgi:hypothetical protein
VDIEIKQVEKKASWWMSGVAGCQCGCCGGLTSSNKSDNKLNNINKKRENA